MEDVKIILSAIMGCPNANLSLRRRPPNLQRRLQRGKNRGHPSNPESLAWNRNLNGDSCRHVLLVLDLEQSCKSLGEHHRSHLLSRLQSPGTAWISFRI